MQAQSSTEWPQVLSLRPTIPGPVVHVHASVQRCSQFALEATEPP